MNLSRLVKSELLKIRTTKTWWVFVICIVVSTGLAGGVRMMSVHMMLTRPPRFGREPTPEQMEQYKAALALKLDPIRIASDLFTAGQFLGCVLAMLLGILIVTSEYQHQTATTTFLTTPKRVPVVVAKLLTSLITGFALCAIVTVVDLVGGTMFLSSEGLASHLGEWPILQSLLLNLMMYGLWSVFGVGWGVLVRNQLAATTSGLLGYVLGGELALVVFKLIHEFWIKEDWVFTAMVIVPTKAAEIAVSPTKTYLQSPAQWVGILVMIAYGLVFAAIGTIIIRKRDVT